jgi:serine/threonine-protein kinase
MTKAASTLVGRTLSRRYLVHEPLGAGGMGTVYEATDLLRNETVAIKALNAASSTPANLKRLRREARICRKANSEHVCRVHCMGIDNGVPFLVMERLRGETVRQRLRREGAFAAADAIAITIAILDALEACHALGMIHRDVKPSNVFLTTAPGAPTRAKLIDFGLARPLPPSRRVEREEGDEGTITTMDVVPGTPHYLSPEQICGMDELDERVDVWGAAMTLFEMLTGRRVHGQAPIYAALVHQILFQPIAALSTIRCELPPDLDHVLARALAKDRGQRFKRPADFRTALVAAWAKHRAAGIARGLVLRRQPERLLSAPFPPPVPDVPSEPTEVEIVLQSSSS